MHKRVFFPISIIFFLDMDNELNLLSVEENREFENITMGQQTISVDKHCLYLTFVDLKWVKQWHSMSIGKNNEYHYFYILGKQGEDKKYHKVIPFQLHNKISCKR